MSVPDRLAGHYAALATGLDPDDVSEIETNAAGGGPAAGAAKRRVARAVVDLYHGADAASRAEAAFDRQFVEGAAPEEMPTAGLPGDAVDGDEVYLPRVLAELGLAASRSEARRLIDQGGVRIDGEVTQVEQVPVSRMLGAVLQVGKRRFVRIAETG
jgi:tyrosyl-tRNA synthetase